MIWVIGLSVCIDHNPMYAQPPSVYLVECEDRELGIGDQWVGLWYVIMVWERESSQPCERRCNAEIFDEMHVLCECISHVCVASESTTR